MNNELEAYIKDLAINQLMSSPVGDKIEQAIATFEKVQNHLYALSEKQGEERTTTIKIGMIMTLSILQKFMNGKKPTELTEADWKEIANDVSNYAILPGDQKYTEYVFWLYEQYIRGSADDIEAFASEKTVMAVRMLADELQEKAVLLRNGEITEVKYIEDCMWISLEAMIKLIASMASLVVDEEFAEYAQALANYAFEYGRFILYSREQELINEFIQSQYELDAKLEQKYALFKQELEAKAEQFYVLIDNAFAPNFRETFLHSIVLAQATGVDEKEILMAEEDIDSFFMD